MFSLLRLVAMVFVGLSVVYLSLYFYFRAGHRAHLMRRWVAESGRGDSDAFVDPRLEDYSATLRRRLVVFVYVLPLSVFALVIYLTNFA